MSLWGRLREFREYPDVRARLESAQRELSQAQKSLEKSELERQRLSGDCSEARRRMNFSEKKAEALQAALDAFCPKLESLAEMIKFYETISPSLDPRGFTLYRTAEKMTGMDLYSYFAYEDNRGMFEAMDGRQLLRWLTSARFGAVEWEIVTGTCYEQALLREVDTSAPEYRAFECELYRKVLDRMGFGNLLAPEEPAKSQEKGVTQTEDKITELKLYSPLSGELRDPEYDRPRALDGNGLAMFQKVILQGIEDERMPEEEERGLMAYFDGSDTVNEKVLSLFPSVEELDGMLCGVAVCRIRGKLSPDELAELKLYCAAQYNDSWGEGFAQRPRHTEYGDLYVSFHTDSGASILTKEELERASAVVSRQIKRGGESR